MWSVWCRAVVGAMLMALVASLEFYDQLPDADDLLYQDDNDIDPGPSELGLARPNDVMMQRLFKAMQLQRMVDDRANGLHPSPLDEVEHHLENLQDTHFKGSVYKRLADVIARPALAHRLAVPRPQQKWKIKKGKSLGPQLVCYFKLCAFRSPH